jgi:SAM-dependent methyltransferase
MNRYHRWFCSSPGWAKRLEAEVLPWALADVALGPRVLEIGPGPGLATDLLRHRTEHLTCVEIDQPSAEALRHRMEATNVTVVHGDGTKLDCEDETFSAVVCLTMLHHMPSGDVQDQLFAEVHRVLAPGGHFVGRDSVDSLRFRINHLFDTGVPVDPRGLASRLARAGFVDPIVESGHRVFRFQAVRS